jgi:hypothetical protein
VLLLGVSSSGKFSVMIQPAHVIQTVYWKHVKCKTNLTASDAKKTLFQSKVLRYRLTLLTNRLKLPDVQHSSFALRITQLKSYSCNNHHAIKGLWESRCKFLSSFSFPLVMFTLHSSQFQKKVVSTSCMWVEKNVMYCVDAVTNRSTSVLSENEY